MDPDQTTEHPAPSLADRPLRTFLDELASAAPIPGGGAAAALAGAAAAALIAMVCNLTIGRPRYARVEAAMREILAHSEEARARLTALIDEDAAAYQRVAAALRLPRATDAERAARTEAIQQALQQAVSPPLETMRLARALLPLCLEVAAHGNPNVVSDAGVAAELAAAAVRAASLNVRINLMDLADADAVARSTAEAAAIEAGLQEELDRTIGIVRAKTAPRGQG